MPSSGRPAAQKTAESEFLFRCSPNPLFTEPQRPDKLARRLADDLKLRVQSLDTLETGVLTPTAYEDGMRRNLQSLQDALK